MNKNLWEILRFLNSVLIFATGTESTQMICIWILYKYSKQITQYNLSFKNSL